MTQGLTTAEAERRLERHGPNRLPAPEPPGVLQLFVRQFLSPFIYILLAAAGVAVGLQQYPSAVFIMLVLLINAGIGTVQEYFAQNAAAALRSMVRGSATVIRDGREQSIDVEALVPGDILLLASGDKVAADAVLVSSWNLGMDESMLTGESRTVEKDAGAAAPDDAPPSEQRDRVFAGTIVTRGRGMAEAVATGTETQIGRIAGAVSERKSAEPPLIQRMRRFTYAVAGAIVASVVLLFAIMVIQGGYDAREILLMSMGLVVSAIPEGLPAALTVTLALGMNRMARRNVIIRRLIAVEALGSCTYICSDKTGTLTVNELTVRRAVLPDGTVYTVGGEGLDLGGDIEGGPLSRLHDLLLTAVCANEGHLAEHDGRIVHSGDMVDVALLVLAEKAGFRSEHLQEENATVALMPYEPERAWAGSINTVRGESRLFVKGSGERIAEMCERMRADDGSEAPFDAEEMEQLSLALARQGYRVIALASGPAEGLEQVPEAPQDLVFEGFLGMIDPLRPEAAEAIRRCRSASIEVAMITGDHPETARHIALELGLIDAEAEVVTGKALREATARDAADPLIRSSHVFARIEPDQKRQIVESLIRDGHFVAVTGDGVNDAPALRHANAGVAMGKRGSDVARETSDLIITDDNFASILAGVEEGRVVYNNIRKVIALLISTGASAILLFFLSALSGLPPPLTAVQLLWLNLVANGVQDVALGFEPAEGDELDRPPRRPGERIFERRLLEHVAVNGIIMGVAAYLTFGHFLGLGEDVESARNLTLMLMVLFGNVHVLNTRSETRSIFAIPLARNPVLISSVIFAQAVHIGAMYTPVLSGVLDLQPIDFDAWLQLLAVASILIVADELLKLRHRRAGI